MNLHAQILEKDGRKEFVVLPYDQYLLIQDQLEKYEDLRVLRESKAESYGQATLQEVREKLNEESETS
jgi:hypothetical protein